MPLDGAILSLSLSPRRAPLCRSDFDDDDSDEARARRAPETKAVAIASCEREQIEREERGVEKKARAKARV